MSRGSMTSKAAVFILALTAPLAQADRNKVRGRAGSHRRALGGHVRSLADAPSALVANGRSTAPKVTALLKGINDDVGRQMTTDEEATKVTQKEMSATLEKFGDSAERNLNHEITKEDAGSKSGTEGPDSSLEDGNLGKKSLAEVLSQDAAQPVEDGTVAVHVGVVVRANLGGQEQKEQSVQQYQEEWSQDDTAATPAAATPPSTPEAAPPIARRASTASASSASASRATQTNRQGISPAPTTASHASSNTSHPVQLPLQTVPNSSTESESKRHRLSNAAAEHDQPVKNQQGSSPKASVPQKRSQKSSSPSFPHGGYPGYLPKP